MVNVNGREVETGHRETVLQVISRAGIPLDTLSLIMVDGRVIRLQEAKVQKVAGIQAIKVMQIVSGG